MSLASGSDSIDATRLNALEAWLAEVLAANSIRIGETRRLAGGAIQENWELVVDVDGGAHAGQHRWVLRTDAPARLVVSLDRAAEFSVLKAAHRAGVRVAEPIVRCDDAKVIGAPFLIQAFAPGIAQARRIVRDGDLPKFGENLSGQLGAELAKIHRIIPQGDELSFLPIPLLSPARTEVGKLRSALDGATEARPALEYVLSWLDTHAPRTHQVTLVHGDYRTGNYLMNGGALSAVLDWEFAHWGDPHEDVGWFLARCWRFGNDTLEAGGIGTRQAFVTAYNRDAASPMDEASVPYWEIMAAAKWAAIAVLQGDRFRKGQESSIELALTGLMAPEMELDALDGIAALAAKGDPRWR